MVELVIITLSVHDVSISLVTEF